MKRAFKIGLTALLCAVLVASVIYFAGGFFSRDRNMAKAREHLRAIMPMLRSDPRFASVEAFDFYRHGGTLLISGNVQSDDDLAALQKIMDESHPPVLVLWEVEVRRD